MFWHLHFRMFLIFTHINSSFTNHPDSKVHGANMGPTWVLSAPDGPHVGPMNLAIRAPAQANISHYCWAQAMATSVFIYYHIYSYWFINPNQSHQAHMLIQLTLMDRISTFVSVVTLWLDCRQLAYRCTQILTHWLLGILFNFQISNFQANFGDWWLRYLLWNFSQLAVTELHWW